MRKMSDRLDRFDKPKLDLLEKLESTLMRLTAVWEKVGIESEACRDREMVVFDHLKDILDDMVQEQESMLSKLLKNIEVFQEDIDKLHTELCLDPYKKPDKDSNLSILQLEKELRAHRDALLKTRNEKMSQLEELVKSDAFLSRLLDVPLHEISREKVPTEEQLSEYEERIASLTDEKKARQKEFLNTRQKIVGLINELESSADSTFEQEILEVEEDEFILSDENLSAVQQFLSRLEKRRRDQETVVEKQRKLLVAIWDCLETPEDERKKFLDEHSGLNPKTILDLQEELVRCRLLKIQNLKAIIKRRRQHLLTLWDKCFFSKEQRHRFRPCFTDEFSEAALEKHEQEIQRIDEFYRQNCDLFDRVQETQRLWDKFVEFERYTSDPNRFVNRGCYLLMEEKDRNRLLMELEKVEQDTTEEIELWEGNTGQRFLVWGLKYRDYVKGHWDDYRAKKEAEKQMRRGKAAAETVASSGKASRLANTPSRVPSKPTTPIKLGQPSPSIAPGKAASNLRARKIELSSASGGGNPGARCIRPLGEQNRDPAVVETEKLFSQVTVSTGEVMLHDPDETLGPLEQYQDFALTLNENYRLNCRSSVIPKSQKN